MENVKDRLTIMLFGNRTHGILVLSPAGMISSLFFFMEERNWKQYYRHALLMKLQHQLKRNISTYIEPTCDIQRPSPCTSSQG